jgi:hypothetical protein
MHEDRYVKKNEVIDLKLWGGIIYETISIYNWETKFKWNRWIINLFRWWKWIVIWRYLGWVVEYIKRWW